jgi:hypothetical protein
VSSTPEQPQQPANGRAMNVTGTMPIPGNAELAVYIIALIVAMIVTAASDAVTMAFWFDFFKWTTAAYLLSRGIAKASRVFEQ